MNPLKMTSKCFIIFKLTILPLLGYRPETASLHAAAEAVENGGEDTAKENRQDAGGKVRVKAQGGGRKVAF